MDDEFDETQEGKIITPLPPGEVHSADGIVSPKPPLAFIREQNMRLKHIPQELEPNDDFDE